MLNKTLALLLVFSLAFNIAFLGIWAYHRRARAQASERQQQHQRGPDGRRERRPDGGPWAKLGLSPEQEGQLEESRRELERKTAGLGQEAAQHRERLYELLESDLPDQEAVLAEQEAIDRIQQQQRRAVIEQMLEMRKILTPEQRQAWLRMMREYRERTRRRGRFGGPRPEGGPPGRPEPGQRPSRPGAVPPGIHPEGDAGPPA